ncbi:MAG: hypothetical protein JSR36_03105 [Proteobacteria bacterium]|nr:hypothetical protein [Pseudomonadota bacterium]
MKQAMAPRLMLLAWLLACAFGISRAASPDAYRPWNPPETSRAMEDDEYAWRLFVALNWPAGKNRGAPDSSLPLGAGRPVVWESWKNSAEVFRPDGSDPGPWEGPPFSDARRFEVLSRRDFPNLRQVVNGRMEPVTDPLAHAMRAVEVRMNRASFEYVRAQHLYTVRGQLEAVAGHTVSFPAGSIHVKAAWRPINPADSARYHTVSITLADGSTRLYGLTALNISAKTLPNWFWASFEHADNQFRDGSDGWLHPSRDTFACRGGAPDCNLSPRGLGLDGTVWQYYRLRGTLSTYVDKAGQAALLGNSELEAGLQASASCITCHARASIGTVAGTAARLPIFRPGGARQGYVGPPDPAWFQGRDGPQRGGPSFQPLDFVWSLSQAAPELETTHTRIPDPLGDRP